MPSPPKAGSNRHSRKNFAAARFISYILFLPIPPVCVFAITIPLLLDFKDIFLAKLFVEGSAKNILKVLKYYKIESNIVRIILAIFVNIIEDGLQILLAFLALKYSFIKYKKDDLEETEKEQTESSPTEIQTTSSQVVIQTSSYFDGGLLQYIGWSLLGALITFITLGICFPCAYVMIFKWEAKHTVINGQRLKFDGKATQLLGNWILWLILTVITFGIFSFWIPIKLTKWKTKHTSFIE